MPIKYEMDIKYRIVLSGCQNEYLFNDPVPLIIEIDDNGYRIIHYETNESGKILKFGDSITIREIRGFK